MHTRVAEQAQLYQIVVFIEDEALGKEVKLKGSRLTNDEKWELEQVLDKLACVLDSSPGLTSAMVHRIDTGVSPRYGQCLTDSFQPGGNKLKTRLMS